LTGAHIEDLRDELRRLFAREIAADLEFHPDMSRNPLRMIVQQLANLYQETPKVHTEDRDLDLSPIVTPRLYPLQQQTEMLTLGINEAVVRVDWEWWRGATEATYRPISPDLIVATPDPSVPDQPIAVEELRPRTKPGTFEKVWTWDVYDVSDPENPVFRIDAISEKGTRYDATNEFAPDLVGSYPYMYDGAPVLPYVIFHKRIGAGLWNYRDGVELVRGSLRLAALWSHWCDGYQSCAHPQRYALDVDSQAGITRSIGGVSVDVVPIDRKSILKFRSAGPGTGSIGALQPSMEPRSAAEALKTYSHGLAIYAGLNPSDLQTTQAQSGYAIVVGREGMRRVMKAREPSFMASDRLLLATAAKLANSYGGHSLPTEPGDYTIEYRGAKESDTERKARAEMVKAELDMGLISKVDALRSLHPEIESDEEAIDRLLRVNRIESAIFQGASDVDAPSDDAAVSTAIIPGAEPLAATALNGAQIASLLKILTDISAGVISKDAGVAIIVASFPTIPESVARRIVSGAQSLPPIVP
jgi:hypothetical protein